MSIPFVEPFRIKMVERIKMTTREQREEFLKAAWNNLFNVRAEDVFMFAVHIAPAAVRRGQPPGDVAVTLGVTVQNGQQALAPIRDEVAIATKFGGSRQTW